MSWLVFSLMTLMAWGLYGAFLHTGQMAMGDPVNGRYKAFLFVGLAYFLTAVLMPLIILKVQGASWSFPAKGALWSLIAGSVGSAGAFCVLLAFGARGNPAVVMSIVFAGAPIVNALYVLSIHPPAAGWSTVRWQFYVGLLLAAVGAGMVTLYKPDSAIPGPRNESSPPHVSSR